MLANIGLSREVPRVRVIGPIYDLKERQALRSPSRERFVLDVSFSGCGMFLVQGSALSYHVLESVRDHRVDHHAAPFSRRTIPLYSCLSTQQNHARSRPVF